MKPRGVLSFIVLLLLVGCGPRKIVESVPPPVPEHVLLYRSGIGAFQEATPEGYQRASEAFRKASALEPSHCEYPLHLAESLMFLAQEQKLNWEEFSPRGIEAAGIVNAAEQSSACSASEPFILRLRAISQTPDYQSPGPASTSVQVQFRAAAGINPLAMIDQALEADPNDPMNWIALWKISPTDPRSPLLRAVDLAPDLPMVQYELGNFFLIVGKYAEAHVAFSRALALNPRHFKSVIGLAYSLGAVDPNGQVEPLYRKAVDIAPGYLEGRTLMGSYYAGLEETEKAVEEYQVATNLNPNYDPAYLASGSTLLRAERIDEAERAFIKVIELRPATPEAHYNLGNIELTRGDLAKAKAKYQEALRYRVNFAEAIYGLANILYREGNVEEALAQYDRAIRANQNFAEAYVARAGIRAERRLFMEAIGDYERAIRLYEGEAGRLNADVERAESQGWLRKAAADRKARARIEGELKYARDQKDKAQAAALL